MSAIRLEKTGGLVTARFDKPRGNAIDEPFVKELAQVARDLGADPGVQGVMLASAHPKLFCPGLDLVTLLEYDRPSMQRFMGLFTEMLMVGIAQGDDEAKRRLRDFLERKANKVVRQ